MKKTTTAITVAVITIAVILAITIPYIPTSETYTEQEVYFREAHYRVVSASQGDGMDWFGKWAYHWIKVVIDNQDTKGGTFKVRFYASSGGLTDDKFVDRYLAAGQTSEFYADWDITLFQSMNVQYTVTAPTVQDTRYVQKTRTVFKSLLQIWFG